MPLYDQHSDEQLAAAARDEDLTAWETLLRRQGPRVLAFLDRMVGDETQARELWLKTWAEAWKLRGGLAGGGRTMTMVFALALRWALQAPPPPAPSPQAGDPASLELRAARLREALLSLPLRQRAALCLCYLDNLPFDEAGRALGCGGGEAKQLCAEGYAALSRHLGPGFLTAGL
jgi:RNA polymerase sigma-70 factor (ECF subfamily)